MNFSLIQPVLAHEAYVLSPEQFRQGLAVASPNPLGPLVDLAHLPAFLFIVVWVVVVYCLSMWWSATRLAERADKALKKLSWVGLLAVRLAIAASFLYGAAGNNVFGPELSLSKVILGKAVLWVKVGIGITLGLGFLTELSALLGLVIFGLVAVSTGPYVLTYLNYLGELIVLALFGSRVMSVDQLVFGRRLWVKGIERLKELEVPVVRIFYGLALVYAGYTIKFRHQIIPVMVYGQYHLERYFHASAEFIAAGAGLAEILIGLFLIIGFAQRLTIFISLVFITASLLYFREMVWPHLMLYGLSVLLFINSADKWTLDRYLVPWILKGVRRKWR